MEGNSEHDFVSFLSEIFNWVSKYSVAILAASVGAIIKTGKDWVDKRPLTLLQRTGLFMITLSFGLVGWWVCRVAGMTIESVSVPLIILSCSYLSEDILRFVYLNRSEIINWVLFRNWKNDKTPDK